MSRVFSAVKVDDCEATQSLINFTNTYLKSGKQNILFVTDDRFYVFKAGEKLILCRSIEKPIFSYMLPLGLLLGTAMYVFFGFTWWLLFPALLCASQYFITNDFLYRAFKLALSKRKYKGQVEKVEAEDLIEIFVRKEVTQVQ